MGPTAAVLVLKSSMGVLEDVHEKFLDSCPYGGGLLLQPRVDAGSNNGSAAVLVNKEGWEGAGARDKVNGGVGGQGMRRTCQRVPERTCGDEPPRFFGRKAARSPGLIRAEVAVHASQSESCCHV